MGGRTRDKSRARFRVESDGLVGVGDRLVEPIAQEALMRAAHKAVGAGLIELERLLEILDGLGTAVATPIGDAAIAIGARGARRIAGAGGNLGGAGLDAPIRGHEARGSANEPSLQPRRRLGIRGARRNGQHQGSNQASPTSVTATPYRPQPHPLRGQCSEARFPVHRISRLSPR